MERQNWREVVRGWLEVNERSQAWLARKAGFSEAWLSRALRGKVKPSARALARLERVMGLAPGTLNPNDRREGSDEGAGAVVRERSPL